MEPSFEYQHPEPMHHGPTKFKKDITGGYVKRNNLDDKTIQYILSDKVALSNDIVKQRYDDGSSLLYPKNPRGRNGRPHQKQAAANKEPEDFPDDVEAPTPQLSLDKHVDLIVRDVMMGRNNTVPRSGEFTMECLDAPMGAFTVKIAKSKQKGRARKRQSSNAANQAEPGTATVGEVPNVDPMAALHLDDQAVANVAAVAPSHGDVDDEGWLSIGTDDAPTDAQSINGAESSSFGRVFSAMATRFWG